MSEGTAILEALALAHSVAASSGQTQVLICLDRQYLVRPVIDAIGYPFLEVVRPKTWKH